MNKLLELKNINFSYSNSKSNTEDSKKFSLNNISFDIYAGDFISIIGKNGSGKSTVVKLISKILLSYSGNIFYKGTGIHSLDRKEYSRNAAYIPQTTAAFSEDMVVKEFLLLGRYAHKKFTDFTYSDEDRHIVDESILETSTVRLENKYLHELSGGEKQKVLITLALVQLDITKSLKDKILIIDEPLTYLDVNYQFEIFNILDRLRKKNLTVVIVIHDLNLALRFSDKAILMSNGELIRYSETRNVITEEMLSEYFLINSKILSYEKNYFINYLPD